MAVAASLCGGAEAQPASPAAFHQEQGRGGSKDLDNMKSDRMRTVQLNVCDSEEVARAVDYITSTLKDPETGGEGEERLGSLGITQGREGRKSQGTISFPLSWAQSPRKASSCPESQLEAATP